MTAAWMAYALVVGALLAIAARGLDGVCRLAAWPVRWVWAGALAITLALIALAPRHATPRPPVAVEAQHSATAAGTPHEPAPAERLAAPVAALRRAIAAPVRHALAGVERYVPASADRVAAPLPRGATAGARARV